MRRRPCACASRSRFAPLPPIDRRAPSLKRATKKATPAAPKPKAEKPSAPAPAPEPLILVSSNPNKGIEAERILGTPLLRVSLTLPEIQAATVEDVTRYKVEVA